MAYTKFLIQPGVVPQEVIPFIQLTQNIIHYRRILRKAKGRKRQSNGRFNFRSRWHKHGWLQSHPRMVGKKREGS